MNIEYFKLKALFSSHLTILRKRAYDLEKNQGVSVTNQALFPKTRSLSAETRRFLAKS
jgi:hypothetical protein